MKNKPIDIIIPWVDSSDPQWQQERKKALERYRPEEQSNSEIRFQSWDNLRYWFRAVERFMPWVHKIFFVTWGHVPEFLNPDHPGLRIVKHGEYIPKEYLPTFNSNTIEMNYHRIPDLSENFIIFNDDMIPLQPVMEEYYFKNDMICDEAVENIIVTASFGPVSNMARYTQINNMMVINRYFKKREVQKKNPRAWFGTNYGPLNERTESLKYWDDFPGFHDPHMPSAMKKSTLERLWNLEPELLHRASQNHFRACSDVTQYLIRYWQLCEGRFYPRKTIGQVFYVDEHNYQEIADGIRKQRWEMICTNENCSGNTFQSVKMEINSAFNSVLAKKSKYEW